jgi:hypothetical protein
LFAALMKELKVGGNDLAQVTAAPIDGQRTHGGNPGNRDPLAVESHGQRPGGIAGSKLSILEGTERPFGTERLKRPWWEY